MILKTSLKKKSQRSLKTSGTGLWQCSEIKQNMGIYVSVLSKKVDTNTVLEADRSFARVT